MIIRVQVITDDGRILVEHDCRPLGTTQWVAPFGQHLVDGPQTLQSFQVEGFALPAPARERWWDRLVSETTGQQADRVRSPVSDDDDDHDDSELEAEMPQGIVAPADPESPHQPPF